MPNLRVGPSLEGDPNPDEKGLVEKCLGESPGETIPLKRVRRRALHRALALGEAGPLCGEADPPCRKLFFRRKRVLYRGPAPREPSCRAHSAVVV